jgi:hypothetical protein
MKTVLRGLLSLLLVALVVVLGQPGMASAAEGFNVITSPLPIKISTPPGKTVETELRIKNQGSQAEGIKVGLMKFSASGDGGQPNLYDLTSKDTFGSWVHFSPQQFTAQPNVWYSVKMTIDVPATADLGYYMAVTFSPANQPDVPRATDLKGSAATLVLLNVVTPNEKRKLDLVSFETTHNLYEYLPVDFKIKVHNSGNIYIAPVGNIFIQQGSKVVSTLDFNAAGGSVLPGSNRIFTETWKNGFPVFVDRLVNGKPVPDKHDIPKRTLKWDFTQASNLRIGHYTAKLLAVYDNGTQDVPLEASVSFWVLPWKIMLAAVAILAIVGFGIFSALRSIGRKAHGKLRGRKKDDTK